MRAPFQVLALPYRRAEEQTLYAIFHRSSMDIWQFISGGGEDDETPDEAAAREVWEESGVRIRELHRLTSLCYIPTGIYPMKHRQFWKEDLYVLPEFAFAFECADEIKISDEHTHFEWLPYDQALLRLKYDSNRTALYELHQKLINGKI